VEPVQITPEPDEAERKAILAALAAENAERPAAPEWRGGEDRLNGGAIPAGPG
jgi:hypothetical protein